VGYLDGSLRLFDLKKRPDLAGLNDFSSQLNQQQQSISSHLTFNGHKTSITSIGFDSNGTRLVTGSKDTDIVVWDLVGECGLFRLKGHKAPIAKVIFMNKKNVIISRYLIILLKKFILKRNHNFINIAPKICWLNFGIWIQGIVSKQ
jgi:WD40 repeat protein